MKQFIIKAKEWAGSFTIERQVGKKKVQKKINIRVFDNECYLEYTKLARKLEAIQKKINDYKKANEDGKPAKELSDEEIKEMSSVSLEQIKLLCPDLLEEDLKGISQADLKSILQYVASIAGGAEIDRTEEEKKSPSLSATERSESSEAESQAS